MRILIQSWTYFRKLGKATFISVIMQPAKNWGDLVVRGLLEIPCSLDTGKLWKVAQFWEGPRSLVLSLKSNHINNLCTVSGGALWSSLPHEVSILLRRIVFPSESSAMGGSSLIALGYGPGNLFLQSLISIPSFSEMMAPLSEQKPKIQGSKIANQTKTKIPEGQTLIAVCGDGWPCAEWLSAYANNNLGWCLPPWRKPTRCLFQQRVRFSLCWVELISPWPVAGGNFKGSVGREGGLENTGTALTSNVSLFLFEPDKQWDPSTTQVHWWESLQHSLSSLRIICSNLKSEATWMWQGL